MFPPRLHILTLVALHAAVMCAAAGAGFAQPARHNLMPGFRYSPWFGEQVSEQHTPEGVRLLINAPGNLDPLKPTLLVLYATPNGNTIEETMGSAMDPGVDWHFDIQHVAAQIRRLREIDTSQNICVACLQPDGKSWPAWRQKHVLGEVIIRELVDLLQKRVRGSTVHVAAAAHSGVGSFLFGLLESGADPPAFIDRLVFLDADYSFDPAKGHADVLKSWLKGAENRQLVVIAYDDRKVTLNGKPVVSPTGGTYRASHAMVDALGKDKPFTASTDGPFEKFEGFGGRAVVLIHANPENKILHTALVGEMNGLLFGLSCGTKYADGWGELGGPRAYTKWIQPAEPIPGAAIAAAAVPLPARLATAPSAHALLSMLIGKTPIEVEAEVAKEIISGNIPDFLRSFKVIHVSTIDSAGVRHSADFEVMPDYLAVGANTDFIRMPLTPETAAKIAAAFSCVLPTRKMVDDIYRHAEVRLDPVPLTQDRESLQTFIQHNTLIEEQREGKPLGLLVVGAKKDIVITNLLLERPGRVAIYGWHRLDGDPIQPLTIVHRDTYVDYSHGVRLVRSAMLVDGKPSTVAEVLKDPVLNVLLSDEGPIVGSFYGSN